MYLGRIVEIGNRRQTFTAPKHPYTQSLLAAAVTPDPPVQRARERIVLTGDIPSPVNPPPGCVFHTRCPVAEFPRCQEDPPAVPLPTGGFARCHFVTPDGHAPELLARVP